MEQKKEHGDGEYPGGIRDFHKEEAMTTPPAEAAGQAGGKAGPQEDEAGTCGKAAQNRGERDVADAKNALQALRTLTTDEDEPLERKGRITLASILGGDMLGGKWFRKQFWFIVMVVGMVIVYVGNRYACQQEMLETKVLSDTLLDRRYKALTRSSQLKEKTRRSNIEESLADSTLQTSSTPLYNLKVD